LTDPPGGIYKKVLPSGVSGRMSGVSGYPEYPVHDPENPAPPNTEMDSNEDRIEF
jgi:hypothetical protein